jgi:hypothetical protein
VLDAAFLLGLEKGPPIIVPLAMCRAVYGAQSSIMYVAAMPNQNNAAIAHLYPGRATGLVTRVAPGSRNLAPRFPRPTRRRRAPSGWRQGIIAVLALLVCVTLGVLGTDAFLTRRDAAVAMAAAASKELYIGSILFYPDLGNRCHQLFFDNRNGQYADNGKVDCTQAVTEMDKDAPKNFSAARTEVISKGFH